MRLQRKERDLRALSDAYCAYRLPTAYRRFWAHAPTQPSCVAINLSIVDSLLALAPTCVATDLEGTDKVLGSPLCALPYSSAT